MMLDNLKKIVQKEIKKEEESEMEYGERNNDGNTDIKFVGDRYGNLQRTGFEKAKKLEGTKSAFLGSLKLVKENYVDQQRQDKAKEQKNINNCKKDKDKIEVKLQEQKKLIELFQKKIEDKKEKINSLKRDIIRIEENPESIDIEKPNKVIHYIGLGILVVLSLYMFIFYSSASYSAFFKNFTEDFLNNQNEGGVINAVFDPKALEKAMNVSVMELGFILMMVVIFFALGYILHIFQKIKKTIQRYLAIAGIILVTFTFDSVLAYKIEEGMYEIKVLNSTTDMPVHTLSMAITSINYWMVIFAGFLVSMFWGVIFDRVMKYYDVEHKIQQQKNIPKEEIIEIERDIEEEKRKISDAEEKKIILEAERDLCDRVINGDTYIIDYRGLEGRILNFTTGWTRWMTANDIDKTLIEEIWKEAKYFIDTHRGKNNQDNNTDNENNI